MVDIHKPDITLNRIVMLYSPSVKTKNKVDPISIIKLLSTSKVPNINLARLSTIEPTARQILVLDGRYLE